MAKRRILIVDDDRTNLKFCEAALEPLEDVEIATEQSPVAALESARNDSYDLILSDLKMPEMEGTDLLKAVREFDAELPFVILTAFPDMESAIQAMKLGASDYLTKPIQIDDFLATVRRQLRERQLAQENRLLANHMERPYQFPDNIIGESSAIKSVLKIIKRVARFEFDVLVTGETGTGKELVARSIHRQSDRASNRFVSVNCSAIPESLIESELFGHERGAFSGATARKLGLIEYADKGTLFLDEIGELPVALQSKLLRVLQERSLRRLGGNREVKVDIRVVAATNRDLKSEISHGRFREDLYYRLNVMEVALPPLRARQDDISLLVRYFVKRYAREMQVEPPLVSDEFLAPLLTYRWPGNIRELQNMMKRMIALCDQPELDLDLLPDSVLIDVVGGSDGGGDGFFSARDRRMNAFERAYLENLMSNCQGDVSRGADIAQVPLGTLYRFLKKHSIQPKEYRTAEA